jgi:hypothetical protein
MRMRMRMMINRRNARAESLRVGIIIINELIFLILLFARAPWTIITLASVLYTSFIIITINNHPPSTLQFPLTLEPITPM